MVDCQRRRLGATTHAHGELELEGRPLEEGGAVVIAAGDQAVWPSLLDVHAVDDLVVASDLAHRGASVPQEDCTEPAIKGG